MAKRKTVTKIQLSIVKGMPTMEIYRNHENQVTVYVKPDGKLFGRMTIWAPEYQHENVSVSMDHSDCNNMLNTFVKPIFPHGCY